MSHAAFARPGSHAPSTLRAWDASPRLIDLLLTAAIIVTGLPETVCPKIYVGEVPLVYVLQYAAGAAIVIEALTHERKRRTSWRTAAVLVLGISMGIAGLTREAEAKWWIVDATMYAGLLMGLVWSRGRSASSVAQTVQLTGIVAAVLVAINVLGLATGMITPVSEMERKYNPALFNTAGFVAVAFPFWFVTRRTGPLTLEMLLRVMPACLGIASVFAAAYISATRSLLILAVVSVLCAYWAAAKDRLFAALVVAIASVGLFVAMETDAFAAVAGSLLAERLSQTSLADEARYVEVEMLFDDLQSADDTWWGRGFGSRFASNVIVDGQDLAFAPHIGALTPWLKGGLPAFALVIVLPALAAVLGLVLDRGGSPRQAGRAAMIAYLTLASLSGGWDSMLLFLYGAFAALSLDTPSEDEPCAFSAW